MERSAPAADDTQPQPRYRTRTDSAAAAGPSILAGGTPAPGTVPGGPGLLALGPRDVLSGRLVFDGDVQVRGTIEGEATLTGDLQVESRGSVRAKVQARNLEVRGTLEGEVTARERLLIAGSGVVSGAVKVTRLTVEDGALLNGTVSMERPPSASGANGRPSGQG